MHAQAAKNSRNCRTLLNLVKRCDRQLVRYECWAKGNSVVCVTAFV